MNDGSFVLRLSKALWDQAAARNGSSSSTAAPKRKKKSTYSSDDCVTCGSIALAGREQCISCKTGVKSSGNASKGAGSSSGGAVSSGVIIPAAPKIMPRFSLSSGGKIPNIVTTRRLQPSECSQLIEREILYVKSLQERLPRSIQSLPVSISAGEEQLTCIGSMTYEEIAQHLISLRVEPMQRLFRPVLAKIMQHPRNLQGLFNRPVDTTQEGLKAYGEKIAVPMDLGTIRGKLQRGEFESLPISVGEMRLVFQNAMEFNPAGHTIHAIAKSLLAELEAEIASLEEKCVKDTEKKISHSSSCRLCGGEQCNICGEKCIKFESSVLLCHGPCMGRVKRNSVYYVSRDGMMLWCQRCFSGLPQCVVEGAPNSDPPRPPVMKRSLLKCKSDEEVSEPWVECDHCHKWVHQVCALYNDRYEDEEPLQGDGDVDIVSDESPRYECPRCKLESKALECVRQQQEADQRGLAGTLRRGKKRIQSESGESPNSSANAAMETEVGLEIDVEVNSTAIKAERKRSRDLGNEDTTDRDDDSSKSAGSPAAPNVNPMFNLHIDTKLGTHLKSLHSSENTRAASTHRQWNARDLPRSRLSDFIESMVKHQLEITGYAHVIPSITIRMTSNIEQYVEVPEPLVENLMNADGTVLPKFLDYKQKCVLLFQKIEGVDVCLFSLYVQEFGNACPAPNTNCVYISYLDSVDYFRPVEARTMVYHEIMVAYLKWVQLRGFKQAHIWACPPQRGDNFIFWCHPTHQRTPSRERLTNWYVSMLERATLLGVVEDAANLFDNYFQPYLKKERVLLEARAAAKNSFVGAGRVVKPGTVSTFAATLQAQQQAAEETREARESGEQNAPVCPPIFEGDFWVNEYLRLHRVAATRISTEDGHDRDLNRRKGREWLKLLMTMQTGATFSKPVDAEALNLLEYRSIISKPMDLGTVRENLRLLKYEHMLALAADIRLTFLNAMTFNPPSHYIHQAAAKLLDTFNNLCVSTVKQYSNGAPDDDEAIALVDVDAKLATYPLGAVAAASAGQGRRLSGSSKALKSATDAETGGDDASTHGGSSYGGGSPRALGGSTRVSFVPGDEESEANVDADDRSSSMPVEGHDDASGERMSSHASVDSHSHSHGDDASRDDGEEDGDRDGDGDGDGMDAASISGSEQPDFAPPSLRRQDSLESCVSTTLTDDCNPILSRRPFHSGAMSGQIGQRASSQRFIRPAMGTKAAFNTMGELAQGVDRLKSDLFVVFFASPNATEEDKSAAVARREAKQVGDAQATAELEESERIARDASFRRNKKSRALLKQKSTSNIVKRTMNSAGSAIVQSDTCINKASLELAHGLVPDTSDPDENVASPFVDSRHTFLEMCQFRHYQFDTLRRAKHSSQMALFHLHNPYGANTRPTCVVCRGVIRDVRWHCSDGCADSDTCQDCYVGAEHCDPTHKLTPFRVTFM